ncbi:hypothetical protein SKAU_G00367010 [Synaphobranchus kaupii]|uniref:Uncharacterized protein n=1 Tax=Synaphobranchus kaupii TaxID=118154 RepID=A0A9Q1EFA3_SYNKA|nr:hypothetical protein SKAU_G00367010 [Synaphobranchus kaupii]
MINGLQSTGSQSPHASQPPETGGDTKTLKIYIPGKSHYGLMTLPFPGERARNNGLEMGQHVFEKRRNRKNRHARARDPAVATAERERRFRLGETGSESDRAQT